MQLVLLDCDRESRACLGALLARLGHRVEHAIDESAPPDAVILALPAPPGHSPETLKDAPLLLLVGGSLPFGELEAWIAGRMRWALLSKPVRETALEQSLMRITRGASIADDEERAFPHARR